MTTVENIYDTGKSDIRVAYILYKDFNYIDVTVNVYWNDAGKGLKLEFPLKEIGRFIGKLRLVRRNTGRNLKSVHNALLV